MTEVVTANDNCHVWQRHVFSQTSLAVTRSTLTITSHMQTQEEVLSQQPENVVPREKKIPKSDNSVKGTENKTTCSSPMVVIGQKCGAASN
jgi:hypothetical protein